MAVPAACDLEVLVTFVRPNGVFNSRTRVVVDTSGASTAEAAEVLLLAEYERVVALLSPLQYTAPTADSVLDFAMAIVALVPTHKAVTVTGPLGGILTIPGTP